jgi:hypothetical protein
MYWGICQLFRRLSFEHRGWRGFLQITSIADFRAKEGKGRIPAECGPRGQPFQSLPEEYPSDHASTVLLTIAVAMGEGAERIFIRGQRLCLVESCSLNHT